MCFVRISEQTATFALYIINRLVLYNRGGRVLQSFHRAFLLLHKIKHQQMHYIYEETLSHYIISYCTTRFDVYTSSSGAFSTMVFTRLICCTVDFEQTSKMLVREPRFWCNRIQKFSRQLVLWYKNKTLMNITPYMQWSRLKYRAVNILPCANTQHENTTQTTATTFHPVPHSTL
jgi:hypothetical protein